jgi:hypothetical protein
VPAVAGRFLAAAFPNCQATFYPEDAHLSVPLNHQEEILGAIANACANEPPDRRAQAHLGDFD